MNKCSIQGFLVESKRGEHGSQNVLNRAIFLGIQSSYISYDIYVIFFYMNSCHYWTFLFHTILCYISHYHHYYCPRSCYYITFHGILAKYIYITFPGDISIIIVILIPVLLFTLSLVVLLSFLPLDDCKHFQ